MAETTTTATPAATSAGFDQKAFGEHLIGSLKDHIAAAVKPLADEIAALKGVGATAATTTAGATADKPLTAAELTRMLDDRDQQRTSQAKLESQKSGYVSDKMKDVPQLYQGLLGSDPTKWPAEEQEIRTRFRADFKIGGGTTTDVGGDRTEGASAAGAIDLSKMNTNDKIALGLRQSVPARAAGAQKK